jgi:hypothetical protein
MLKRLLAGFLEGGLAGTLVAFLLARLALSWDATAVVYAATAVVGVLTGLVAGKPIWARAAKTEASIKAVAGAFIAVVTMFGIRKWLPGATLDLSSVGAGAGPIGHTPFVALPLVGTALALVFEVDDAFGAEETTPRHRAPAAPHVDEEEELDEPSERRSARRRG